MRKLLSLFAFAAILLTLLSVGSHGGVTSTAAATNVAATAAATAAFTPVDEVGYTGPLDKELYVYNWADYIDDSLISDYEQKYGVKITYDNYDSNETLFAKLQAGAKYDVIFPSDYLIVRLIQLKLVAKLDKKNIPNIANIDPYNLNNPFDKGADYCVPYMWGTTGIAYLRTIDKKPEGWAAFFDPEQVKYYNTHGGINVLADQRELIGAALQYLGYSYNDSNKDHIFKARDTIIAVKQYFNYMNSSDYQNTLLIPKEVSVSHAWNGDAARAAIQTSTKDNPLGDWAFIQPKEGGARFQDGMCVTASSPRKATAEHFINYLLRAESAARITDQIGYISANLGARPLIDQRYLSFLPSLETIAKLEWYLPLDDDTTKLYNDVWTEINAAQ